MKNSKWSKEIWLAAIRRGRGLIQPTAGEQPFAEWWAEHKRAEREIEDRKLTPPPTMGPAAADSKKRTRSHRP